MDRVWRREIYWLEKTLALARADLSSLASDDGRREARVDVASLGELADTLDRLEGGMTELRLQVAQRDERIHQLDLVIAAQQRQPAPYPPRARASAAQTDEMVSRDMLRASDLLLFEQDQHQQQHVAAEVARTQVQVPPQPPAEARVWAQLEAYAQEQLQEQLRAHARTQAQATAQVAGLQAQVSLLEQQLNSAVDERTHAEDALSKLLVLSQGISVALEAQETRRVSTGAQEQCDVREKAAASTRAHKDERARSESGRALSIAGSQAVEPTAGAQPSEAAAREAADEAATDAAELPPLSAQVRVARAFAEAEGLNLDRVIAIKAAERVKASEQRWRLEHLRAEDLALKNKSLEERLRVAQAEAAEKPAEKPAREPISHRLRRARSPPALARMEAAPVATTAEYPAPGQWQTMPLLPMPFYGTVPAAIVLLPHGYHPGPVTLGARGR
ncbi:hypothetical protein T492DRAFT_134822 [Pavlovales sp. CCMP2436]|nr:hypothetical protein T492DRAFT_134822 [Pavlovales sp. CCMP2436]|mmetsp:Transcript_17167/g.40801  ORF Transcript_17167/g.40801 Transcript_17167/m.40801 type:complete len:447 (+) Transcript_17167:79-1419(+)